jgi:hypothetical protein
LFDLPKPAFKLFELRADSGAGNPESLFNALVGVSWMQLDGDGGNSCLHHEIQSAFCLTIEHYILDGHIDVWTAIQLLKTICKLFHVYGEGKGSW